MQVGLCGDTNILLELPAKIEAFETAGVSWEDVVAFSAELWLWGVQSINFPRSGGAAYTMGKVKWDVERKERKGNKSGGREGRSWLLLLLGGGGGGRYDIWQAVPVLRAATWCSLYQTL